MEHVKPSAKVLQEVAASSGVTQVYTNPGGVTNQVWISLPQAGNLQVGYASSSPANFSYAYIWHQGGTQTPIIFGGTVNTYPVGAGDFLVYQLANDTVSIKLFWSYQ